MNEEIISIYSVDECQFFLIKYQWNVMSQGTLVFFAFFFYFTKIKPFYKIIEL